MGQEKRRHVPRVVSESQKQRKRDRERRRYQDRMNSTDRTIKHSNNEHEMNDNVGPHYLGSPNEICCNCSAILWKEERVRTTHKKKITYSICCKNGKVSLPTLQKTPALLDSLLNCENTEAMAKRFRDKIRSFNSMFVFTSLGAKIDYQILKRKGPYTFRIHGQHYHRIGSLLPEIGCPPRFAQLYIYDTEHEVENRLATIGKMKSVKKCDVKIVDSLQNMLQQHNKYVKKFHCVRDWYKDNGNVEFSLRIIEDRKSKGMQYNAPSTEELAVLMVEDSLYPSTTRDIIIKSRVEGYKRISEMHPAYMPLQYPILFPYGEDGWHSYIDGANTEKRVTMLEFYAYRLQQRRFEGTTLLRGGKLFQQYIVDAYASIEEYRLRWIRNNQQKLRCELYQGIQDVIDDGDIDVRTIGKKIILPSSFTGGPRYMIQNYQDAMAICACLGPPDIFITFTCNPKWREIEDFLMIIGGQSASDRPDIVARVFHMKLTQLLDDLIKHKIFGRVIADLSVVEFQKRGLPHCHILITVEKTKKIKLARDVDTIVSAEIPNYEGEPLLHDLVIAHMIHGPCGAHNPKCVCMSNNKCSKKFPKAFNDHTIFDDKGYVLYRRRNTKYRALDGKEIDNSWVVPYNAKLLLKYQCHINIEICNHRRAIKYLFKYVNKGPDLATAIIHASGKRKNDEIKQYLDSRYIAAAEASWRIFEFNITQRHPAVERLQYHLCKEQMVLFKEDDDIEEIMTSERVNKTMLTEWFVANVELPNARKYTYIEFPTHFVWDKKQLSWRERKRGIVLGRLPYAHPAAGESYFLRMLLTVVKGRISFEDVRTIDGVEYGTYKAACVALGLLDDDNEWHLALSEASNWASAKQLRRMFCTMLLFNEIANPLDLWNSHWKCMSDDYERRFEKLYPDLRISLTDEQLKDSALRDIDMILSYNNKSLKDFLDMPVPSTTDFSTENRLLFEERNYNHVTLLKEAEELEKGLNDEQRKAFVAIMSSCEKRIGELFFIYGGGGTGKTYLWNAILARLRSVQKIVLAVASSGIASLLLPGGRTAHSRFKIPIDIHESSSCAVSRRSNTAALIKETALVIWDEAPMMNRFAFEAVDRMFKDILSTDNKELENKSFGGKTVVLGGDFRQILPVIHKGKRQQIVSATIHKSCLWDECKLYMLTKNMRVKKNIVHGKEDEKFADWLIDVGNGVVKGIKVNDNLEGEWIKISNDMLVDPKRGIVGLIDETYSELNLYYTNPQYLKIRAILACRNEEVDEINKHVISKIKEESRVYLSADTKVCLTDDAKCDDLLYTTEFLNSLTCSGLPPHSLELKVNTPVMLLRNLDQSIGLCNGTRLMIKKLGDKAIKAEILTGTNIGKCVAIPRIIMSSDKEDLPFVLRRRQFPIRLAFGMTINKSQGQTLEKVGLYLSTPVFCHGQLYVALSRATCASALKILLEEQPDVPKNYTQNVVYKEVLQSVSEKV